MHVRVTDTCVKERTEQALKLHFSASSLPEATPLPPEAAQAQGTSRSDWPPDAPPRDSTPCPCWRRLRSGHRGAGRTAGPAGLSTGHLGSGKQTDNFDLRLAGGLAEEVSECDLTCR